jgi:hypothetical protein
MRAGLPGLLEAIRSIPRHEQIRTTDHILLRLAREAGVRVMFVGEGSEIPVALLLLSVALIVLLLVSLLRCLLAEGVGSGVLARACRP